MYRVRKEMEARLELEQEVLRFRAVTGLSHKDANIVIDEWAREWPRLSRFGVVSRLVSAARRGELAIGSGGVEK